MESLQTQLMFQRCKHHFQVAYAIKTTWDWFFQIRHVNLLLLTCISFKSVKGVCVGLYINKTFKKKLIEETIKNYTKT